jgi:hypothetical protein
MVPTINVRRRSMILAISAAIGSLWRGCLSLCSDQTMPRRRDFWERTPHSARADLWSGGGQAYHAWRRAGAGGASRRGLPLGFVAITGAGLLMGAVAVPLLWAATQNTCTAFETALLRRHAFTVTGAKRQAMWQVPVSGGDRRSASRGLVGQQIARIEYPGLPTATSCILLFWQVRIGT